MDCSPWWALAAVSAVTLVLHALLLATLYVMLGRKIERLRGGSKDSGTVAKPEPAPAPAAGPAGDTAPRAAYAGGSDTSSETSDDSDSSPSVREGPRSEQSLNYSSLRFAAPARAPADYANVKPGPDYVNVDPKKKKGEFWAGSSSAAAKAIEYTEVKL